MIPLTDPNNKNWLRRFFLGGLSALGIFSSFSDGVAEKVGPSTSLLSWISDSKRKEGRDGFSVTQLSQQPSGGLLLAAHRSHRSHASHYSSTDGHRSHYSHYSSYSSTPVTPPQATPKQVQPVIIPPKKVEVKKQEDPNSNSIQKNNEQVEKQKANDKLIIEAKNGIVKSVMSPTTFILDDATIVELIGVKTKEFPELSDSATARSSAMASLTGWVKDKPVRINFLNGKKAYVFVFPNELECLCINLEMVKAGNLIVDNDPNICAYNILLNAQNEAKVKKIGIWEKETDEK